MALVPFHWTAQITTYTLSSNTAGLEGASIPLYSTFNDSTEAGKIGAKVVLDTEVWSAPPMQFPNMTRNGISPHVGIVWIIYCVETVSLCHKELHFEASQHLDFGAPQFT